MADGDCVERIVGTDGDFITIAKRQITQLSWCGDFSM